MTNLTDFDTLSKKVHGLSGGKRDNGARRSKGINEGKIKVIFLSHMFPNSTSPLIVPFMVERAKAISAIIDTRIIAPVSFFPILRTKLPPIEEKISNLSVKHPRYLALPLLLWSLRWFPYLWGVRSSIKDIKTCCDILHIEWIYPDAYALVKYAKKRGVKTIGVVHGNEAVEYFGPVKHREKYIRVLKKLDKIIVVSNDLKNKLINEYNVENSKISVIINGVDIKKFPMINQKKAISKLGLSTDTVNAVCVARLSEEKNLDILIKSAAAIGNDKLNIYIIGEGPLQNNLEQLIKSLDLVKNIKLVGPIPHDEIFWWLNAADFFCLPSQREGCPVSIHEALACGVPVISTNVGAIPDLISDEKFGFLCEPDNVEKFTTIMKKAISTTWERGKISTYGRQFTWDNVAQQTVKVLLSVLD